ncbi:conjugative transposon protein TraM [Mucilaginibacter rubeus]|uniref:conjugative transposon protein TraM n=1 Tax=Mucilaginibacter rubeus TaxID=2027860 RepID=UPI00166B107B|nr:conjugative transposon protein TraM [Mucilaginibacter rubeus]GGA94959.1 conjugative transposon protein TraM [Mucilaginibacter rubeus]
MKVNFKSPRYVLPLILLPFFLLLFYTYKSSFGKAKAVAKGKDTLQDNLADVSDQVKKSTLSDKLDAYRDQYKKADGYTAINQLQDDTTTASAAPNLYNDAEKRKLDSLKKAVAAKYKGKRSRSLSPNYSGFPDASALPTKPAKHNQSDQALAEALNRMRSQPRQNINSGNPQNADPMQLFRQQMALIDSMDKSHDPDYKAQQKKALVEKLAAATPQEKTLPVTKASNSTAAFNTIMPEQHDGLIRAIVDQNITGYAGSRLRIRLLEDMMAGHFLVKQGTYLYAEISGFTGQRVLLTIKSIMEGDQLLPVKLSIYDNDGLPGLYVPASAFRDFTKDLGSDASQGLTLQQSADNNNQMVMSVVSRMFESTTTAVSKLIRQNKAKLKYNTLVYLIDPETLRNHQ